MNNKITQLITINQKLHFLAFFSLFILTQCATDDKIISKKQNSSIQQRQYPQQYYQAPQNVPYYQVPNSQAYSNPYDFQPPYSQNPSSDNDDIYVLPNEYYLR